MSLNGEEIDGLVPVLSGTLNNAAELDRIVYGATGDRLFKQYASENATLDEALFQLLTRLSARGIEMKVLGSIYRDRPDRPDVRKALATVCPAAASEPPLPSAPVSAQRAGVAEKGGDAPVNAYAPALERNVRPYLAKLDLHVWAERLARIENQVCRVEIGGNAVGTGFLVGPSVVLTNWHVAEDLAAQGSLEGLACRFNHVRLSDGARSEGRVATVLANGLVDCSPYAEGEDKPFGGVPVPGLDELDYALLKLADPVGNDVLDGGISRGFLELPGKDWNLKIGAPLLIVQHPDGAPMKLAMDTQAVLSLNANGTRIQYTTNTEPGSSGSPCFSMDWDLVALHHSGDPAWGVPLYNQGVPIGLVRNRLIANGHAALIGVAQ
ncbi:trypsin-like serine peptidase [Mesorhizobium sp. LjNodule214]|uniref:trypsin-like serine peptidase n=1 Tax=Mesorhizobium sp. LjNodule214 TaxID=3342252 RepID=UPI003ED007F2